MTNSRLVIIFTAVCLTTLLAFVADVLLPSSGESVLIEATPPSPPPPPPPQTTDRSQQPTIDLQIAKEDVHSVTSVGGIDIPDPKWPTGGIHDASWPLVKGIPTRESISQSENDHYVSPEIQKGWKGVFKNPISPHGNASNPNQADSFPVNIMYFYDDIANHSVFLLQTTLNIVEPNIPQISMYVEPKLKKPEWSFTVKLDFILKAIRANWGKVIVVIDTDMIFYRPWGNAVAETMAHYDLAFQGVDTYSPSNPSELKKLRKTVVFAISTIRCNEKTEKFFLKVKSKISCNNAWIKGRYDQEELIAQLGSQEHSKLKWTVLPREFWGPSMSRSRCKMPPQPIMCHPDMKKGKQGGQWMIWHRKTEWKIHHIISQHCMGRYLIDKQERGDWWHPYSLLAGVTNLITPSVSPVHPDADVIIFSEFYPDDWCRFTVSTTLRLHEPTLSVQFVNVSRSSEFIEIALQNRPANRPLYFLNSCTVVLKPFHSVIQKILDQNPSAVRAGTAHSEFVVARSGSGDAILLPPESFHLSSNGNATFNSLICVSNTLRDVHFPYWSTARGVQGYLTLDERHFFSLAYTRCGLPYSDPYHTMDFWKAANPAVTSC